MRSRMLLCIAIATIVAAVPTAALAQGGGKKRPNIVYVMSDDHASAAIGCYNSWLGKYAETPNLDRLARKGIRFTNGCVTNSICTPSRAALLTGKYSHKNGVYTLNDALDPMVPHVAHLLRAAGYQIALIGKWHLHSDPTGFDYWAILPGQGVYHDPKLRMMGAKPKEFTDFKGGYSEDVITKLSIEWLKKRDRDKPFVLFCHFRAPHRPWDPAKRYVPAHYGVRTERYTLAYYYGKALNMKGAKNVDLDPEWELFDREKDPQQLRNVYAVPAYADVVRELRVELARLRKHYGDEK